MGYVDPWSVGTFLRLLFSPGKKKKLPIHFVLGWFFSGLKEMIFPQIRNQQRAKPIRSSKVENKGKIVFAKRNPHFGFASPSKCIHLIKL